LAPKPGAAWLGSKPLFALAEKAARAETCGHEIPPRTPPPVRHRRRRTVRDFPRAGGGLEAGAGLHLGRYTAKPGILVVNAHDAAKGPRIRQLWTTQEFPKNFILKLEFRAAVNADSGIFLRKPQLQCRDYLVAGPYKQLKKYKAQDWNEIIVTVKDNVAHCECNGEVLEDALKIPANGPIGLEADRDQMEYQHIQIKELP
jgi:hypothetical protein